MPPKFRASKINLPGLPSGYLVRPRLDALWEDRGDRRIILVTAGAGFGKTSFLAEKAASAKRPCAWFSLNELDAHPERLAERLLEAMNDAARKMAGGAQISPDRALAALVTGLREERRGRMIILDDVHTVTSSSEALGFIERLARFLPAKSSLVLSSREHLDIPIMRLQAQGEAARLESIDLSFSEEEVAALFEMRLPGLELEPKQARRVASLTEGWAAGLEIFFQYLGRQPELLIEETLDHFQGAEIGWFPYFAEEVINQLEPELQLFLMRSSVLPRLEAELCDEVLKASDSAKRLKTLARGNLFTFPTGAEQGEYRYHQLFRDALRERLSVETGERELRSLHEAAGKAFRKRELWMEAVAAFAAAGDAEKVLRLVDKLGEALLDLGRYDEIREALESLPAASLRKHPGALMTLGRIHDIQGQWPRAEKRYRQSLKLCKKSERRVELMSLLAQLKMRKGQYRACLRLCDEALAEPGPISSRIRGRILGLRGVSACDLGRYAEGEAFLLQAEAIFRRSKDEIGQGRVLYLLAANVHAYLGDLKKAKSAARRSLSIFRRLKEPRRICHSLGVLGWVMFTAGELREARQYSEAALRQAESLPYPIMVGVCRYTLGRCDLFDGDLDSARTHFEAAERMGQELGEAELQCVPYLGLSLTALAEGNRHAARKHAEHALSVAKEMKERQLEGQCNLVLGLCFESTRKKRCGEYWSKAEELFRSVGASYWLHHLMVLRLDALSPGDEEARALLEILIAGVAGMEHENLFLVVERDRASRVLTRALRLGVEPEYVTHQLSRLGAVALPELLKLSEDDSEAVRLNAVELLSQIGGGDVQAALLRLARTGGGASAAKAAEELEQAPSAPMRVLALGPLLVDLGDHELPFGQWKSKRALRLFQLLLSRRFRWIPQEQILDQLWPDADPKKAKNNLRQSVFLLRKALEPEIEEARKSHYVRHRNEACRLEPGESHYYDVAEFETLLDEAETFWKEGGREKAAPLYERALELYRGDFLSESPYEEIAVEEREYLRDRCRRAIARLLEAHEAVGRHDRVPALCRRGLSMDPYEENFHRHLVSAQIALGNRREALEDFHRYEQVMIRELDLMPSARMQELADKAASLGRS